MHQAYIKKIGYVLGGALVLALGLFILLGWPGGGHTTHGSETPLSLPVTQGAGAITEEDKQYRKFPMQVVMQPVIQQFIAEDRGKIQVIEFFNYGCYWCQQLQPALNRWLQHKPTEVVFYRFPVIFNRHWEVFAKAYYVAKLLGKSKTLDKAFFTALHDQHLNLADEDRLRAFFVQHGVSEKEFSDLYHSFTVNREIARTNALSHAYQITHSPSVVINTASGSYVVTPTSAGGEEALLSVVDRLIARELSRKPAG